MPEAKAFHAIDHWGTICIQEIETEKYLLRHYLFVFEKTITFTLSQSRQGIQSLLNLKGNIEHKISLLKGVKLQEKEFILFDAAELESQLTVEGNQKCSLLQTHYSPSIYNELIAFFPAFKKDLKKASKKPIHFLYPPKIARYTAHDAINAIWHDRYIKKLQVKHIELRLTSTLFTLLAQTYSSGSRELLTPLEKEKATEAYVIISKDIRKHQTLEEIASKLYCSSSWLKKAFAKMYGIGMFHFLRQTRMERARQLLLQGESLKVVAIEIGMKPQNFPKEFKAFFGYTVTSLKKSQA
ncbi:MAG: AraC family transcriptional regulator [Chitinophagaceae bacterium]